MATIKDVAKKSGYGIATVSYALKNHPKIPEATRRKIKEIADELNYLNIKKSDLDYIKKNNQ